MVQDPQPWCRSLEMERREEERGGEGTGEDRGYRRGRKGRENRRRKGGEERRGVERRGEELGSGYSP